jgi:peptide/nickel transport system substrate-binding protein
MTSRYVPARTTLTGTALAACAALLLSACGGGSSTSAAPNKTPTGRTLNLSFLQDPGQPPDPDVFYGTQGLVLTTNLYEGLLAYKAGTASPVLVPALATSWTHSADNTVFTFELRRGVTFHDGTPFTAAAIKASFDRRLAVDQGPAYMVQDVSSITTHGKYAATIKLKTPDSNFLEELASPYGPKMMSPTALAAHAGKDHDQTYLRTHDIGTGPYALTEAKTGSMYQLKAYPKYWGKKAYFTTVNFPVITDSSTEQLQFESGSLAAILHDLPSSADSSYAKNSKYATYSLPTEESDYLYVNPHTPAMSSQKVRDALLQAINVKTLVNDAYFGRGTAPTQIFASKILPAQYAKQNIKYDPSVLKAAVASLPAADRTVTIGYDSSSPDNAQAANLLVGQLAAAGLTAKVQSYPVSEIFGWVGNQKNAPDMLVNLGFPDAPTPYLWEHINFDPDGGVNLMGCSSPAATKLIAQGLETGSAATFSQAAEDAQATGCWMNLVDVSDFMVAQPWLKGIRAAHVVSEPTSLELNELYK